MPAEEFTNPFVDEDDGGEAEVYLGDDDEDIEMQREIKAIEREIRATQRQIEEQQPDVDASQATFNAASRERLIDQASVVLQSLGHPVEWSELIVDLTPPGQVVDAATWKAFFEETMGVDMYEHVEAPEEGQR